MSSNKYPNKPTGDQSIAQFLSQANKLPQRNNNDSLSTGRLIFALDATASRQPSWDRACQLQAQIFSAADKLSGLQLQLCYYRGYHEFYSSPWLQDSRSLLSTMSAVQCLGGYTQLQRVLNHSLQEHSINALQAVIIIADAVEENVDQLCTSAGKLGMMGVPLFMFQEGFEPTVRQCFQQMAMLSKGAYASFDESSAQRLADLLTAVATYASGGLDALQHLSSNSAQQLLQQLKN